MNDITLTINDLATLRNVIDLASTRGAFRASELKEVGEVYERLTQFVEASILAAQTQQESQAVDNSQPAVNQQSPISKGE
jgi:hypothetical protein